MLWNNSQPPIFLQKSKLFQFLFLIRKLYLTRTKLSHFSQFAEDVSLKRFFSKNRKGTFVDVGWFHPKKYNNTWQLYKRGWSGVNIDIDPIKIKGFDMIRPRDHNVACAVGCKNDEIEYYTKGYYSLTNSTNAELSTERGIYAKKTTTCRKLNDILEASPLRNQQIDFLTIDAEGNDFDVLKSLNFETYKPMVIAIETNENFLQDVIETNEFKFLKNHCYDLVAWCGMTIIFINKEFSKDITCLQ
tara:strand:+ start:968 stop:1702 length:735 start_codon:yes stop_codon:yes gene_type:complete